MSSRQDGINSKRGLQSEFSHHALLTVKADSVTSLAHYKDSVHKPLHDNDENDEIVSFSSQETMGAESIPMTLSDFSQAPLPKRRPNTHFCVNGDVNLPDDEIRMFDSDCDMAEDTVDIGKHSRTGRVATKPPILWPFLPSPFRRFKHVSEMTSAPNLVTFRHPCMQEGLGFPYVYQQRQ